MARGKATRWRWRTNNETQEMRKVKFNEIAAMFDNNGDSRTHLNVTRFK